MYLFSAISTVRFRKPVSSAVAVALLIPRLLEAVTQLERSVEEVLPVGLLNDTFSIVQIAEPGHRLWAPSDKPATFLLCWPEIC